MNPLFGKKLYTSEGLADKTAIKVSREELSKWIERIRGRSPEYSFVSLVSIDTGSVKTVFEQDYRGINLGLKRTFYEEDGSKKQGTIWFNQECERHRSNGPAVEFDGKNEYWIEQTRFSTAEEYIHGLDTLGY